MNENDPAWKLAAAARASVGDDKEALDRALDELKPTSKDIARAYAISLTVAPFASSAANTMILEKRLQVSLMQEHVAAQRRMGRTINVLTVVLVLLTLALVLFGGMDLWQKAHTHEATRTPVRAVPG